MLRERAEVEVASWLVVEARIEVVNGDELKTAVQKTGRREKDDAKELTNHMFLGLVNVTSRVCISLSLCFSVVLSSTVLLMP
jgi:hypothetical protein